MSLQAHEPLFDMDTAPVRQLASTFSKSAPKASRELVPEEAMEALLGAAGGEECALGSGARPPQSDSSLSHAPRPPNLEWLLGFEPRGDEAPGNEIDSGTTLREIPSTTHPRRFRLC